jgi:hypothetical protein
MLSGKAANTNFIVFALTKPVSNTPPTTQEVSMQTITPLIRLYFSIIKEQEQILVGSEAG